MRYMTTAEIGDWKIVLINRMIVVMTFVFPFSEWLAKRFLVAAALLFLFSFSKERFLYALRQKTVLSLLAFVVLMGISWFYTETDPGTTHYYFKRFYTFLILPLLLVASALHPSYIKYVIGAFLLSMFANEFVSYGVLFGWWLELSERGFPTPFMMHSTYSAVVAFTVMLMVYEIIHERNRVKMTLYLLFTLLMMGNLVISGGRTGQISLLLAFIVMAILHYRKNLKALSLLIAMPILFVTAMYFIYTPFQQRADLIGQEIKSAVTKDAFNSSVGNRVGSYVIVYDIMRDNSAFQWILGHGAGELKWVKNRTIDAHYPDKLAAAKQYYQFHNIYMDVYVGMGLTGLLILLLFFFFLAGERLRNPEIQYIKTSLLLIMIFSFLPHHTLYEKEFMMLIGVFVGVFTTQKYCEKRGLNGC
jgi:O-antigen ligase